MKTIITSQDLLILRDGRPFGMDQTFGGTGYDWPMPQTIAGMVRTALGHAQRADFFTGPESDANVSRILQLQIKKLLPYARENNRPWEPLFPVPADLAFFEENDRIHIAKVAYNENGSGEGTDIVNRDWLISTINEKEKASHHGPRWLFSDFILRYIQDESFDASVNAFDIGLPGPVCEKRLHNGIDPQTLTSKDGKLFCNYGIYFDTQTSDKRSFKLGIGFAADTAGFSPLPAGDAFLGGERRVVTMQDYDLPYPEMPSIFQGQKFLKILLLTHGDFGGWCPQWLLPNLDSNTIDWVKYPGTDIELRLRSAVVKGWDAVSGWDYRTRSPKAMKKLVKPGTVYLVELKNPTESEKLASLLWGNTLVGGPQQSEFDGYNHVITALKHTDI